MIFKCPNCHNSEGIFDVKYGILPCMGCRDRQSVLSKPKPQIEFTSDNIKQQRREYEKDIEQPHRKGELNKAWLETYGVKSAKQFGFTDKEIKKAKYVYNGNDNYLFYDK